MTIPGGTIWKGTIHFGDTDVPVKLHSAVKEERIQFHLLHRRDRVRLHQQMICAYEKIPVPHEAQVKGFEVEEGNTSSLIRNSSLKKGALPTIRPGYKRPRSASGANR